MKKKSQITPELNTQSYCLRFGERLSRSVSLAPGRYTHKHMCIQNHVHTRLSCMCPDVRVSSHGRHLPSGLGSRPSTGPTSSIILGKALP